MHAACFTSPDVAALESADLLPSQQSFKVFAELLQPCAPLPAALCCELAPAPTARLPVSPQQAAACAASEGGALGWDAVTDAARVQQ